MYMYVECKLYVFGHILFFVLYALSIRGDKGSNHNSTYLLAFKFECHVLTNAYICMTPLLHSNMYYSGVFGIC
jgi:hypothetical protein